MFCLLYDAAFKVFVCVCVVLHEIDACGHCIYSYLSLRITLVFKLHLYSLLIEFSKYPFEL